MKAVIVVFLLLVFQSCLTDSVIGTVKATDKNATQALTYRIVSGNVNNAFTIDKNSGLIKIVSREALVGKEKIEILVSVTDDGKLWTGKTYYQDTILTSTATITIMQSAWTK